MQQICVSFNHARTFKINYDVAKIVKAEQSVQKLNLRARWVLVGTRVPVLTVVIAIITHTGTGVNEKQCHELATRAQGQALGVVAVRHNPARIQLVVVDLGLHVVAVFVVLMGEKIR